GIGNIRDVIDGIIEIEIVIVVPVHKGPHLECSAHGNTTRDVIGVFQGKVERMVRAETAAGSPDLRRSIYPTNQRQYFVEEVVLVGNVPHDPVMWMNVPIVPAFSIHAVDTKEMQLPPLDLLPNCVN